MGGVMFVSGGSISFSGFLFVSVETVCVFNKFVCEMEIRCTKIFVMCNIIVPLRPK